MPTKNTGKSTNGETATKKKVAISVDKIKEPVVESKVVKPIAENVVVNKQALTQDTLVPCVDMVKSGILIYQSRRNNGYQVVWNGYMDEQSVELGELVAMKSTAVDFFRNNWIIIPESYELHDEVLKYLHVEQYYKNVSDPSAFSDILNCSADELKDRLATLSVNKRDALYTAVKNAIDNGMLDSVRCIKIFEDYLGRTLI